MDTIANNDENKFIMVIKAAMNLPGVQISRNNFLKTELSKYFSIDKVNLAIEKNPASAGISINEIEDIAKSCINYETNKVSAISAAAGIPGGFAMLGTVPADTAQYFAHMVRILQKLMYLYGWQELYSQEGQVDDETLNKITIFIGIMFGVNAANSAIAKLAQKAALQVEKNLVNKALTKGVIYPLVKQIAKILGVKMTKQVFAKSVSKIVPVLGGALSGGLTYVTFKPSADRLKKQLKSLPTADVKFYENDIIDVQFEEEI